MFRVPPPQPEEALKKETAESLLRRMVQEEEPSLINVIFILAVMLERKRILVERDVQTRDDGRTVLVYEHRKTGESFLITDPRLHLDQLEEVQKEVTAMLGDSTPKQDAAGDEKDAVAEADETTQPTP